MDTSRYSRSRSRGRAAAGLGSFSSGGGGVGGSFSTGIGGSPFVKRSSTRFTTSPSRAPSRPRGGPLPEIFSRRSAPLPQVPNGNTTASRPADPRGPFIPLSIVDAPSQRMYAVGAYVFLVSWRVFDWMRLGTDFESPWFLFLKWMLLDLIFLFSLPELRIPWLELSQTAVLSLFLVHAIVTYILMFNISLPIFIFFVSLLRSFTDPEIAVSEHNVKISRILHNSSLIMGKQIINILPEGSVLMNPDELPFCIGRDRPIAKIPLHFNSSVPDEVTMLRIDLFTGEGQSFQLTKAEMKSIAKTFADDSDSDDVSTAPGLLDAVTWSYEAKKPGIYRLDRVLDKYKLEVQRPTKDTFVVPCPTAAIRSTPSSDRCVRDLSNLWLEVKGTPPLKVIYSRTINGKDHSFHIQSLQPDTAPETLETLAPPGPPPQENSNSVGEVSWVRPAIVSVPLNESMNSVGQWRYTIDEVHDSLGNVVQFAPEDEVSSYPPGLERSFTVKDRPAIWFERCDSRQPLKIARNRNALLPVKFYLSDTPAPPAPGSLGAVFSGSAAAAFARGDPYSVVPRQAPEPAKLGEPYVITWDYSPLESLTDSGEHSLAEMTRGEYTASDPYDRPVIREPGLYSLRSISTNGCEGEVREPSSCLVLSPMQPQMSVSAVPIPDLCAGNSLGLNVDINMIGTPPFTIYYDVYIDKSRIPYRDSVHIPGLRHHFDLLPKRAGHHKYVFIEMDDAIYRHVPIYPPAAPDGTPAAIAGIVLEQDVKPAASASIVNSQAVRHACLGEALTVDIALSGDAPFKLEWDIVHDGRRISYSATDITSNAYHIDTPPFTKGGDYVFTLSAIEDKSGCRSLLSSELKIAVRRQQPRAGFGLIEGRRSVTGVEGTEFSLPLRLQGYPNWRVSYRSLDEPGKILTATASNANGAISSTRSTIWELVSVMDNGCPGTIDPQASRFQTSWFSKPVLSLVETDSLRRRVDNVYDKRDVCEGDPDNFEVVLTGTPPWHVNYETRHRPPYGSASTSRNAFDAALPRASISMETSRAGNYTYTFSSLADNLYSTDQRLPAPITLAHTVNSKPSAAFAKTGRSYQYCLLGQSEDGDDKIPIILQGLPPFSIDIEIKHNTGSSLAPPDVYHINSIDSNSYNLAIPRDHLRLGAQQVRIRTVRDARACQRRYDDASAPAVQVHLFDAPAVYPLESRTDYCVGERIAYSLSGTPPFTVEYDFDGPWRAYSKTTDFRRVAEKPGIFTITRVSDKGSQCAAPVSISRIIHPLPSVRISRGRQVRVDIHEGNEVDILFEFGGTPPFDFTYTRSTNAKKNHPSVLLETRHDVSFEHTKIIRSSQEGTYEVVAIRDKYCAFSTHNAGIDYRRKSD